MWNTAVARTAQNFPNGTNVIIEFTPVLARFWRYRVLTATPSVSVSGISFMKFSLGDNYIKSLAAGIIYGAQYTPTVGAAKNVFDGLRTSSWFPCNGTTIADAWIGLAYMTAKEVNRAVIDFNNPYYTPTN